MVEQGGVPYLPKSESQSEDKCNQQDSQSCFGGQSKLQSCHRGALGGMGYEQEFLRCKEEGKTALYHGETSRTLYTRSNEHWRDLRKRKADNEGVRINNSKSSPDYLMNYKTA